MGAEAGAKDVSYWIVSAREIDGERPEEVVSRLAGEEGVWGMRDSTPGRKSIRAGDWLCFYASGKGVVGHGRVVGPPTQKEEVGESMPAGYDYIIQLDDVTVYPDNPVAMDEETRSKMEVYRGKRGQEGTGGWGWLFIHPNTISRHDFDLVTRRADSS